MIAEIHRVRHKDMVSNMYYTYDGYVPTVVKSSRILFRLIPNRY